VAPREQWVNYLTRKLADVGISALPAAEAIVDGCDLHPQDIMRVAFLAYRDAMLEGLELLTAADGLGAVQAAKKQLEGIFAADWQRLAADRGTRIALARIARGGPLSSGLTHAG
jgi:hypothetical protein